MANSKLFKNTVFYSIGEILPRALNFILLPVYTKYLSPTDYGINSYAHTIILFLYVLGAFSLNSYVLRYYFIHDNEEERKSLIGTAQLAIIMLNAVILSLAFLLMPGIISSYSIQVPWEPYFRLAFIINFLDSFSVIPLVVYRVRQEAIKFVLLGFSRTLFTVILTVYLLIVEHRGLLGTFQAQLYIYLPYTFIYLVILNRYGRWHINLDYLKEGLKYATPLIPGAIGYIFLSMSDRIILERHVGMDELGIYNVACSMAIVLNVIIQSGYKAIEPELFRRFGNEGFFEFVRKSQGVFFSVIYISAMALSLFSQEVFNMMTTDSFHKGYILVPALVVGVIMTGQNVIYGGILGGECRTKVIGIATIIGAVVSVIFNLCFVPYWGTYAAAVASAVSFFVMNTILFHTMTFPGKTMMRELFLIILVPIISYCIFSIFGDVSVVGVIIKLIAISIYSLLAFQLMNVDIKHAKSLILKK